MSNKIKVLVTGSGGAGTLGREIVKSFLMIPKSYEIFKIILESIPPEHKNAIGTSVCIILFLIESYINVFNSFI